MILQIPTRSSNMYKKTRCDSYRKTGIFTAYQKVCIYFFGPFTPREFLSRWFQWCIQRNGSSGDKKWGCKRVNICRYWNLKWWRFCHEFCDFGFFKEIWISNHLSNDRPRCVFQLPRLLENIFSGYRNASLIFFTAYATLCVENWINDKTNLFY